MAARRVPGRASGRAKSELERARDVRFEPGPRWSRAASCGRGAIFPKATLTESIGGDPGYILLMAAAIAAAWFGGLLAGMTAIVTTVVLNALVLPRRGRSILATGSSSSARSCTASSPRARPCSSALVGRRAIGWSMRSMRSATLSEAVEARDARLELMLSASGIGFWEWDMDTGELTLVRGDLRQHGLAPPADAAFRGLYLDLIHPDDRDPFREAIAAATEGVARSATSLGSSGRTEPSIGPHGAARLFRDADDTAAA